MLEQIDNSTARALFAEYLPIARGLARRYPWLELDEALQEGRLAILAAYQSYDETRGASLKHWVRTKLRWAIFHAAKSSYDAELRTAERVGTDPQLLNGADPEQQFWRASALSMISQLSPRQSTIITARCHGSSHAQVAATLGISFQRVQQEEARALEALRSMASTAELQPPAGFVESGRTHCPCGAPVLYATRAQQLVVVHRAPTCARFTAREDDQRKLLRWLARYGSPTA